MRKSCPSHGSFEVVLWRGEPSYNSWNRPKNHSSLDSPYSGLDKGCPFDCGLCPDHRQETCTALLEVTFRCDRPCSFCYANSRNFNNPDPDLVTVRGWYEHLSSKKYSCNIQLSGGEPTLRDDLPQIVALGRSIGFRFIQVNTNGLRLAKDPKYVEQLKKAGLSSVFLQFDGPRDKIYEQMGRGISLDNKLAAIENCSQNELGVVIVPTLVRGVNTDDIGNTIKFAIEHINVVRGVHFQPAAFFGRYPWMPSNNDRITLPEIIRSIESQTGGMVHATGFVPPGCENSYCSFHGNFVVMPDGSLHSLSRYNHSDCCSHPIDSHEGASIARKFVGQRWVMPENRVQREENEGLSLGRWDVLLKRSRTHMLCISSMAFQDAWNVELDRLRECCIHVLGSGGRLIPFCAYNLTGINGAVLHGRPMDLNGKDAS
jgi:7,8-dihydro-6-hydroxymethylpterin dimethyltransferase